MLLADLAPWYVAASLGPVAGSRAVADRVAVALAEEFRRGDDVVRAVIASGFLAALPRPDELGYEVVARLPRPLGREAAAMRRPVVCADLPGARDHFDPEMLSWYQ